MHFNMNILAVAGLLAAGVTAQSSTSSSSSSAAASPSMAAGRNGTAPVWNYFNTTVTTVVVVQQFTTVCKEATTLTFNGCEYPATKGQHIVVTNCPCTVTTTVPTMTSSLCPPEYTLPAIPAPPPVQVAPPPKVTPTAIIPVQIPSPSPHPSYVQVGGASLVGSSNVHGLVAAVAAVFAFGL
ncbi:hypothetical protein F5B22DRAFT_383546 [Xylaria bambusicola]|uniref:uncharacterized protein n=1 Tax=Xylaria bambusicola TaxID=326684 RepID=UPI002008C784|nr:uncharacterized protein F5B22DRAFT_383546 [Xylaria bambusicola]KAI0508776.1 hypothetical protein F5B22DRAFT_383546 [Xylaria bambusicola]